MQTICMDGQCFNNYLQINLNGKNVSKFDEEFITSYDEDSNKGYLKILEVDVEYPKDLHNFHSNLPFLSERMKIKK